MNNTPLNKLINEHVKMVEKIMKSTELIYRLALNCMFHELIEEVENRQRLLTIINHLQNKIEVKIDDLNNENLGSDLVNLLGEWKTSFYEKTQTIKQIDIRIVDLIAQNRDQISEEIGHLFKSRELFKGYQLFNVKR